jgi:hypothetical protein
MRTILALFFSLFLTGPALALSGATADGEDRFPYVVEIKFEERLVCSGTVLYPRIVVTAAHCLQHKVRLPGGYFYIDEYAEPAQLTVSVILGGGVVNYDVADVTVSPAWRAAIALSNAVSSSNRSERFAHDIALIVTKEPIDVGLPPSLTKLAASAGYENEGAYCAPGTNAIDSNAASADISLRETLMKQLGHRAVVVAFGAEGCTSHFCGQAGTRRYQSVTLRDGAYCFNRSKTSEDAASAPPSVWCVESSVLPGDSGGALMVEGPHGELYYLGVISAQQGRRMALATTVTEKRSVAAALYPSLDFIRGEARKLGYIR